ncbi:hypothetical protein BU14_0242s0011 [Porphyra umbilicalis]|uniref:Uncharacterized protein n=1 Tax=Porphyra umbilicalis TaxID=2786 RepID=A0A1X6P301_PORUM|nr:hypothetical protein BU14_0242s0011 [Porphyra umbilicalis]|eukprot:OSX75292.1 hypothetical protein BU14_0242s0011 [Porphyra umbilicalis]
MASRAAAVAAATSTRTAMAAKKNVHIENWASFRENCEHVFEVSLKNLSIFGVAGVAVPYCIYRTVIDEQMHKEQGRGAEQYIGHTRRFLGGGEPLPPPSSATEQ